MDMELYDTIRFRDASQLEKVDAKLREVGIDKYISAKGDLEIHRTAPTEFNEFTKEEFIQELTDSFICDINMILELMQCSTKLHEIICKTTDLYMSNEFGELLSVTLQDGDTIIQFHTYTNHIIDGFIRLFQSDVNMLTEIYTFDFTISEFATAFKKYIVEKSDIITLAKEYLFVINYNFTMLQDKKKNPYFNQLEYSPELSAKMSNLLILLHRK